MNLIPDSELIKIPVKDNGEKLVDLRKYCPDPNLPNSSCHNIWINLLFVLID